MKTKSTVIISALLLTLASCIFLAIWCLNPNSLKEHVVYAAEDTIEISSVASGVCGTNLTYELTDDGTLRIEGEGAMSVYSNGSAPWYEYRNSITSIVVDDAVTSISAGAFYGCNSLQEITLPFVGESRTATGPDATFGYIFGCTTLNTSTNYYSSEYKGIFNGLGSSCVGYVSSKYGYSQYNSSGVTYSMLGWTSVSGTTSWSRSFLDYKVGVKTSSDAYFSYSAPSGTTWQYSCNDYRMPSTSYTLQSYYYYIPSSITKVTITDATQIGTAAFMNCSNITEINLNDGITKIGDYAFRNCGTLQVFDLPKELTSIGSSAFFNCTSISDIIIPAGIDIISYCAFLGCSELQSVKFNPNIITIEAQAFQNCISLKNIVLPESLETIGNTAFYGDTSLTEIIIPDNVVTIGSYAFASCSNIQSVSIGNNVTTIGTLAFSDLNRLTAIYIPDNVTTIESGAFYGCNNLQEITLPFVGESRTATGPDATFGYIFGCTTLNTSTNYYSSEYKGIFNGLGSSCVGYVSSKYGYSQYNSSGVTYSMLGWTSVSGTTSWSRSFLDYKVGVKTSSDAYFSYSAPSGTTWQYSCNDYRMPSTSYTLQSYYYYIPSSITKVTITDATQIGTAAFMNCSNITEINLNDGITKIGDYAFRNCGFISSSEEDFVISGDIFIAYKGSDTNIIIPEGIELIAPRAFENNSKLSSVQFSDTVTWIGDYAFYNCTNAIVNVPKISGSLTIQTGAFTNTGSVVYLDMSSYSNGNDTFYYNVNSEGNAVIVDCSTTSVNITLPVTLGGYPVVAVGYRGMAECTTLTSVTIPNNIVRLELYAFAGCTGLTTATIPATCQYVGDYAFIDCASLATVVIAEGVTYLGNYCFRDCTSLTEIVCLIPASIWENMPFIIACLWNLQQSVSRCPQFWNILSIIVKS